MKIPFNKYYVFLFIFSLITGLNRNLYAQASNSELNEIVFIGNENISSSELHSIIISQESPNWFSQFLNKSIGFGSEAVYFDSTLILNDLSALTAFYFDNGYFGVSVDHKFSFDSTEEKGVTLTYLIKEGLPSYFNSFKVTGLEKIHPDFQKYISDISQVDTNDVYEQKVVENKRIEILTYLRNRGLMLCTSDLPQVTIDTIGKKVDIELYVDPGKRYKINEIRVVKSGPGKELVTDELISEIVNISKNEYYNFSKIQLAQTRLYRTNLFNTALISGITADTVGSTVPLQISTDVGLLYEFSPEVIMNDEDKQFNLGLSFGFIRKNFLGDARKITLLASSASQDIFKFLSKTSITNTSINGYADFRILIDQPFLLGNPIYTKLETYLTLQKRLDEYNATIIGSRLSLNFELPPKVYLTSFITYFNFEHTKFLYDNAYLQKILDENKDNNPVGIDSSGTPPVLSNNSIIGVELQAIKTDNIVFPTEGYSLSLTLENANLFPYLYSKLVSSELTEPQYYKLLVSATTFVPLSPTKTSTLGFKLTAGQINTYQGDKYSIPFNQRFTSGGSNSIRGWSARELVSGKADINFDKLTPEVLDALLIRGTSLGGYFLFEGSVEARQKFLDNLGVALFADFGNTLFGPEDFKFINLAVAVGFGFRYYSEIVPIRIDFGFKYYDPNDTRNFFQKLRDDPFFSTMQFHLGIGEAF